MKKQSLEEFLAKRGLAAPFSDYMLDKLRLPHGLTARQQKKLEADAHAAADQYADARAEHWKKDISTGKKGQEATHENHKDHRSAWFYPIAGNPAGRLGIVGHYGRRVHRGVLGGRKERKQCRWQNG